MVEKPDIGKLESDIEHLEGDLDKISLAMVKLTDKLEGHCDKCITRKLVYAVVGLIGLSFVGAVIALVIGNVK